MTTTSTLGALDCRHLLRVEEILPPVCWVIVRRDEVTHNRKVGKLSTPPSPFANCAQPPTPLRCKVLTTSTTERVGSVR